MSGSKGVLLFFMGILVVLMVSIPVSGASTMFRANPQHTGVYDDGGTRPNNILKWD